MVLISVTGVSGKQGGAVVRELLKNGYSVRGITRNLDNDIIKDLIQSGMEAVVANFDDIGTINCAFQKSDAVFLMTNFWEHMNPKREYFQGKNLIDAAITCKVKHIVWSTLEDTRDYKDNITYFGEYKVPHFDEKGRLSRYLETMSHNHHIIYTNLYTSFFYENFTTMMKLQKDIDGIYNLCIPMKNAILPIVSVKDIGRMVNYVIKNEILGNIGIASEHLSCGDITNILSEVLGKEVRHLYLPYEKYKKLGFPGAQDLGNMFEFKNVHNQEFCRTRNMNDINKCFTTISFKDWCVENKHLLIN